MNSSTLSTLRIIKVISVNLQIYIYRSKGEMIGFVLNCKLRGAALAEFGAMEVEFVYAAIEERRRLI